MKEIGKSSRIDDKVDQDQRQRDDYDLQDERQDQPKKEEVEPRRSKRARTDKLFGPYFSSWIYFWVVNHQAINGSSKRRGKPMAPLK
ncbi:hypothetical protein Tco_0069911, partial [Tanacetum coccineum]